MTGQYIKASQTSVEDPIDDRSVGSSEESVVADFLVSTEKA